jgi:hypothetical protein
MFLDSRREDKMFWTEWQQALPEFNLFLHIIHIIIIIIIIIDLQPFVGPWPLSQFLDPIHSR